MHDDGASAVALEIALGRLQATAGGAGAAAASGGSLAGWLHEAPAWEGRLRERLLGGGGGGGGGAAEQAAAVRGRPASVQETRARFEQPRGQRAI